MNNGLHAQVLSSELGGTLSGCRFDENELCTMTIRGSAFLWHQVRCMVAVLFMIGHGFESPEVCVWHLISGCFVLSAPTFLQA